MPTSPGVSHMRYTYLIRFVRASSNLNEFNYRNKSLTTKLFRQGYRYFKLRMAFSKLYRRQSALVEKYSVSLKTLLQQGIAEPESYGDLVYRLRKIVGKSTFSEQFRILINRYKRIGYSLDIMRQTACLVVNPIILDGYASLFLLVSGKGSVCDCGTPWTFLLPFFNIDSKQIFNELCGIYGPQTISMRTVLM